MTWARLDDGFADHPKIVGLSDRAFRLHVTAICYAARHETDGVIPVSTPFVLAARKYMKELIAAGLWDLEDRGYVVHDYLEYNPSRGELDSRRMAKAMAGAKGAASRWHDGVNAPDPTRPVPTPLRSPPPPPDPENVSAAAAVFLVCVRAYDGMIGRPASTPGIQQTIQDYLDDGPWSYESEAGEWFSDACIEATKQEKRSMSYVLGILRRWRRDGRNSDTRSRQGVGPDAGGQPFVSQVVKDIEQA